MAARAWAPVDIASLAAFRVMFGALMAAALLRFWSKGWIQSQLSGPSYHFPYPGFPFVAALPEAGLVALFAVLVACAVGLAIGLYYRLCAGLFLLGFTYTELIDQATYLNHYYLVSLLAFLLLLLPAQGAFSLDAYLGRAPRAGQVPAFTLWALRAQVGVVYFFAGVAKLNADWLLDAQPLRIWLASQSHLPLIGAWLATPAVAYAASWLGALFDLSVVFFLLAARTRPFAFAAVVGFHLATGLLFPIGMFPWIMVTAATLFLPYDWPRRFLAGGRAASGNQAAGAPRWLLPLLLLHTLVQIAVPLERHLTAREAAWRVEGFNFAWNVMVAEKAGSVLFELEDRVTGERRTIAPRRYLTPAQEHAMAQDPHMIRALALHIAQDVQTRMGQRVSVYAHAFATLNGRPSTRLVDARVDLTAVPLPEGWILPLSPRRSPRR